MELVDRYVEAVEAELPRRLRDDVGRELRTLLAESVEEREATGASRRQAQLEVLRDFGAPRRAAERYGSPRRGLIGPGMLPALRRTLSIVLAVLGGLGLVAWIWQAVREPDPATALIRALPGAFSQLVSNLLEVSGLVLLVFAVVEWLGLRGRRREPWDPATLEATPAEPQGVNRWGALAAAAGLAFLPLWVLFFQHSLGASVRTGDGVVWLSLAGPGLTAALPWLVASWCGSLVVQIGLLVRGRWSPGWRALDLAARVLGLAVLVLLVVSQAPLLATTVDRATAAGLDPSRAQRLATGLFPLLDRLLRLGLLVAAVGTAVGIVRATRTLLKSRGPRGRLKPRGRGGVGP